MWQNTWCLCGRRSCSLATAGYGPAGQLLSLYYGDPYYENWVNETLNYNSLLQVTNMTVGGLMNMQYNYSATQNNGRITSSNDYVTGENVTYTYDALNRLTGASAGTMWGEAYTYDGFGNLTDKTVTQAPAPALGVSYDANNHQVGLTYDANGNQLWDSGQHATAYGWNVSNKLVTQTSQGWPPAVTWYSYDPFGRRVMKDVNPYPNGYPGFTGGTWEFYFYGITGQKLVTTLCTYRSDGSLNCGAGSSYTYFGSRLIEANRSMVVTDRLGSVRYSGGVSRSYFPYGEERTSTPDGTEKFGTYFRDGPGQDYAQQRYYNNGTGRFWSVDPGGIATADASNPLSLNRYLYGLADPVNKFDPTGQIACDPDGGDGCFDDNMDDNCDGDVCLDDGGGGGGGDGCDGCTYDVGVMVNGVFTFSTTVTTTSTTGTSTAGGVTDVLPLPIVLPGAIGDTVGGVIESIGSAVGSLFLGVVGFLGGAKPAGSDCEREWEEAFAMCNDWLSQPNPPQGLTGGHTSVYACAKGLVSERCGGNKIDRGRSGK
jgi:RHS repeat-associated protein